MVTSGVVGRKTIVHRAYGGRYPCVNDALAPLVIEAFPSRTRAKYAAFEDALRCDGNYPTAIAGMALVALDRGDVAGADTWLAKIARVPPQAAELVGEARAARARFK